LITKEKLRALEERRAQLVAAGLVKLPVSSDAAKKPSSKLPSKKSKQGKEESAPSVAVVEPEVPAVVAEQAPPAPNVVEEDKDWDDDDFSSGLDVLRKAASERVETVDLSQPASKPAGSLPAKKDDKPPKTVPSASNAAAIAKKSQVNKPASGKPSMTAASKKQQSSSSSEGESISESEEDDSDEDEDEDDSDDSDGSADANDRALKQQRIAAARERRLTRYQVFF